MLGKKMENKKTKAKLDVRLIALDLDDTLLNEEREITEKNLEALKECAQKGIYIVLCSGRAEDAILPFIKKIGIGEKETGRYLIAINGCSIFDLHTREQVFCKKVESDILVRTNEIAEEWGLRSEVYTPDTIYYQEETKWTRLDVDLCGLKGKVVPDYKEFIKQGFTKMLVPGQPELLLKLQDVLRKEFGDRAVIFTSKPYFLEILPPNCGKGEAVNFLAEKIGLPSDTTMAFGDSMNDESMIRLCKYGVCMKNGLDAIKEISDFVTDYDNNNDGIADFLRKYVL